jgi:hypothetical protein
MNQDAIYQKYVEWCRKLGIKPATRERYFHDTSRVSNG